MCVCVRAGVCVCVSLHLFMCVCAGEGVCMCAWCYRSGCDFFQHSVSTISETLCNLAKLDAVL